MPHVDHFLQQYTEYWWAIFWSIGFYDEGYYSRRSIHFYDGSLALIVIDVSHTTAKTFGAGRTIVNINKFSEALGQFETPQGH